MRLKVQELRFKVQDLIHSYVVSCFAALTQRGDELHAKTHILFTLGRVHEVTLKEAKIELFYFFTNHCYHSPKQTNKQKNHQ